MATKRLVITFAGRICFMSRRNDIWAIFLDAENNPKLGLEPHRPLMQVPLSMIASQNVADDAIVTSATFVTPIGKAGPFIDSAGIWSLAGYDVSLSGVAAPPGATQNIADVADLNAIMATVDPGAEFDERIFDDDPRRYGVLARWRLPAGADLQAVTEDGSLKTFQPGGHAQLLATRVTCTVDFVNDLVGPRLRLRPFGKGKRRSYQVDGLQYNDILITVTNLCNCIKRTPKKPGGVVADDPEFVIYYDLFRRSSRGNKKRPIPTVPIALGGIQIPECYDPARGRI